PEILQKRYHIGRILGDGNFAVVRLARRRETGQLYAMKIIDKAKLKGKENMLQNEISIMHQCNHPNIVRLIEEFETPNEVWLAMEFVKDGDLFDGITKSVKFSEPVAAVIVADLANALFYLHCRSIVHRDLKPENVLLWRQPDGKIRVKLADFGLALEIRRNLYTICGTPTYIAPEILCERGYGLEVDMWALGIITYIMLCGFAPFRTPDRRQSKLFESIKRGVFVYLSPYWDDVSQAAKDLVSQLLVVQPRKRLTALETIIHPWVFAEGCAMKLEDSQATIQMDQQRRALRLNLEKRIHVVTSDSQALNNPFTPATQPTGLINNSLPTLFHAVTKPEAVNAKPNLHFPDIYRRIS
ncbi:doublecortin-like kinase 3, partial [Paragonimus westermani]